MKRIGNYIMLVFGGGLIAFASSASRTTAVGPPPSPTVNHINIVTVDYTSPRIYTDWNAGQTWMAEITGTIGIALNVSYPEVVNVNNGFLVTATAKVNRIDCMSPLPVVSPWSGAIIGTPTEKASEEADYRSTIREFFDTRPLEFRLDLVGATISPTEVQRPSQDSVTWSVLASSEKTTRLSGNIDLELSSNVPTSNEYSFRARDVPLFITLKEPYVTLPNILRWGATFLGSLLTLPGILSFMKDQRDYKRRKKQLPSGKSSRSSGIIQ